MTPKFNWYHPDFWLIFSIFLYATCLLLPAAYIGSQHEPVYSAWFLLLGWIYLIQLSPFWLANPLFLIAIGTYKSPGISSLLSFLALVLALSFIVFDGQVPDLNTSAKDIKAYGWGYFFWLTSFAVFFVLQAFRSCSINDYNKKSLVMSQGILIGIFLTVFFHHYYFSPNSHSALIAANRWVFNDMCNKSYQKIHEEVLFADGIFIDNSDRNYYLHKNKKEGFNQVKMGTKGSLSSILLESNIVNYVEIKNRLTKEEILQGEPMFTVLYSDEKAILEEPAENITSEYTLHREGWSPSFALNIYGGKYTIKTTDGKKVVAETSYAINRRTQEFCGTLNDDGYFLLSDFVRDALKQPLR